MDSPKYLNNPIGSVDSLAKTLSIDKDHLLHLADKADSFYYLHERREKADGTFRDIYAVKSKLKVLQEKIRKRIFSNVDFPYYLQGGIKDIIIPRSHIKAVEFHKDAKLLVNMDISNFFPSLTSDVIFDIWKRFFNFPEAVAQLLTKLTTFNGLLPQGAPTSPSLANLAFWDSESTVVDKLQSKGFKYTRYVDDVTVSSTTYTEMQELAPIFGSVFGMFRRKGVKPNRSKIDISTSGHNMSVHNLNINSGVPTIPKAERGRIRAAVRECEIRYHDDNQSEDYGKLWRSTLGRVNYAIQLNTPKAKDYYDRLQVIKPLTYDRLTSIS